MPEIKKPNIIEDHPNAPIASALSSINAPLNASATIPTGQAMMKIRNPALTSP